MSLEELFNAKERAWLYQRRISQDWTRKRLFAAGQKTRGIHQWLDLNEQRYDLGLFLK
jgi:hypothetical protein